MQEVESATKPRSKRKTDWKKIRRLSLQIGLNTAQSFLQGAAVAGGAAIMTKLVSVNPKKDAEVLSFPARRQG